MPRSATIAYALASLRMAMSLEFVDVSIELGGRDAALHVLVGCRRPVRRPGRVFEQIAERAVEERLHVGRRDVRVGRVVCRGAEGRQECVRHRLPVGRASGLRSSRSSGFTSALMPANRWAPSSAVLSVLVKDTRAALAWPAPPPDPSRCCARRSAGRRTAAQSSDSDFSAAWVADEARDTTELVSMMVVSRACSWRSESVWPVL